MTYKLAIFDFDGTLADSFEFFVASHNTLARRHGFAELDPARIDEYRGQEPRELMRRHGIPMWKLPIIARDFMAMMARHTDGIRLFEGIAEALHALSVSGVELAIVTSNSLENVRRVIDSEALQRVRHIESGASIFGKRRRLERVLKTSNTARQHAIYVGDQATDARAAQAAGIAFGAVRWGYATAAMLDRHSPTMTFGCVSELQRIAYAACP
ncbi:haloacid dehalogenase [Steroidobacter agaridevorans]|uniref:Haloacid dehalogenase n=1 Tax=Steroidobacter agaridevorans TaxID=2695856 RepID=A0A829YBG8_9GAMM|nr:HAD hydrolase-like protein [Steroidobacter agaridevorans]GFE80303.1 haloacid dehalogenase [Steroidobacter agaridevorans]GFE87356.1 haloacid dehalogenase [Steroidobacter agaridevorans]